MTPQSTNRNIRWIHSLCLVGICLHKPQGGPPTFARCEMVAASMSHRLASTTYTMVTAFIDHSMYLVLVMGLLLLIAPPYCVDKESTHPVWV